MIKQKRADWIVNNQDIYKNLKFVKKFWNSVVVKYLSNLGAIFILNLKGGGETTEISFEAGIFRNGDLKTK